MPVPFKNGSSTMRGTQEPFGCSRYICKQDSQSLRAKASRCLAHKIERFANRLKISFSVDTMVFSLGHDRNVR